MFDEYTVSIPFADLPVGAVFRPGWAHELYVKATPFVAEQTEKIDFDAVPGEPTVYNAVKFTTKEPAILFSAEIVYIKKLAGPQ